MRRSACIIYARLSEWIICSCVIEIPSYFTWPHNITRMYNWQSPCITHAHIMCNFQFGPILILCSVISLATVIDGNKARDGGGRLSCTEPNKIALSIFVLLLDKGNNNLSCAWARPWVWVFICWARENDNNLNNGVNVHICWKNVTTKKSVPWTEDSEKAIIST